ncbi:MAG TPA: DUF4476 domain-containing protein [Flavitalea sp.]|nr:DUF4476 domain-containing protein [Flavitalea sp.]
MKNSRGKFLPFLIPALFCSFLSFSQQEFYIFLQSDNNQPFYSKIGSRIYSSSAAGHLVIANLKDSSYTLTIGFPKNLYSEVEFLVAVNRKDQGFQLKNMGEQGWVLFNFISLQTIKPKSSVKGSAKNLQEIKKKTDGYSTLMAGVVNDTAVLYASQAPYIEAAKPDVQKISPTRPIEAIKEPPLRNIDSGAFVKTQTVPVPKDSVKIPVSVQDSVTIASESKKKPVVTADTVMAKVEQTRSKKDSTISQKETVFVFRDSSSRKNSGQTGSTVPEASVNFLKEERKNSSLDRMYVVRDSAKADTVSISIAFETAPQETPKLINEIKDSVNTKGTSATVVIKRDSIAESKKIQMINSDCRNFASDMDVDKLRIKILAEKKDNEKIAAARKYYKNKCFTSKQIKALSELFYVESSKFNFLAASYPFVSDSENYRNLVTLLNDSEYVSRFNALFRN